MWITISQAAGGRRGKVGQMCCLCGETVIVVRWWCLKLISCIIFLFILSVFINNIVDSMGIWVGSLGAILFVLKAVFSLIVRE